MFVLVKFVVFASILINFAVGEKLMLCYYGSWATYRNGNGACHVSDLDPFICSHLIYTFLGINDDASIRIMDPWLELPDNWGRDNFGEFNKLKAINPKLKTIIAIGGWNEESARYSKMANDPALRSKFVKEAANFTQFYGFDGFDFDWEYPGQRDTIHGEKDIEAYTQLLKEMREEFDKYGLLLTAAVASAEASAKQSYNIPEISKYLDLIHVMSYDFHGAWDSVTGHNSALNQYETDIAPGTSNDIKTVYKYWLSQGAPKEKIIMGLPLYGRTFRLTNPQDTSVGAPASGAGIGGQYSYQNGMIGLNELCEKRKTESWPEIWDEKAEVPYTYKGNDWITYDDHKSLRLKAEYAMDLDLAGVMVWSIETDDFKGVCHNEKFAYLRTINKAIGRDVGVVPTTTTSQPSTTPTTTSQPSTTTSNPSSTTSNPSSTTSGSSTSTSFPPSSTTPGQNVICVKEGFVRDKNDCSIFYNCVRVGNNEFITYTFKCPGTLYFDEEKLYCNFPQLVNCNV